MSVIFILLHSELVRNLKQMSSFRVASYLRKMQIVWIPFLLLSSCAKVLPPPGGPADLEGLKPIKMVPSPDQIQVDPNTVIEITFDSRFKQVDPNLITLSPFPKKGLKIVAKGKKILIVPQEPLLPDQTYRLTISPEIRDEQNNPMPEPLELLFSTGTKIERGKLKGIVYDSQNRRGVWIWAWKMQEKSITDEKFTSLFYQPPDYVAVTDSMGEFQLTGLADGRYRLLAIDDINRTRKYEPASDKIGITFDDPVVPRDSNTIFSFHLMKRDTVAPAVQSIRMAAPRILTLRMNIPIVGKLGSQPLITSTELPNWIGVLYHDPTDSNRMYSVFSEIVDRDSIQFEIDNWSKLDGKDGNQKIKTPYVKLRYQATDTLAPTLVKIVPQGGNILPKNEWQISASMGLAIGAMQKSVQLIQNIDSTEIPIVVHNLNPFVAKIIPANPLPERRQITLIVRTNEWKSFTNVQAKDTTFYFRFFVLPWDTLGTVSVQVEDNWKVKVGEIIVSAVSLQVPNQASSWVNALESVSTNYSEKIGSVDLKLPNGLWRLRAFRDSNNNGILDVGQVIPFMHSEPFVIAKDSIRVRSRWTTVPLPLKLR